MAPVHAATIALKLQQGLIDHSWSAQIFGLPLRYLGYF